MEDQHHHHHQELQLLPSMAAASDPSFIKHRPIPSRNKNTSADHGPSLDLQLSISVVRPQQRKHNSVLNGDVSAGCVEALKWQAAEQIRLAALEKAYAERVRELSRREMELAQSDFARARHVWERARQEVERAERLKVNDPSICHSCRQSLRP